MVGLYLAEIGKLEHLENENDIMYQLTEERRIKLKSIKNERARKQSVAAGMLLYRVLSEYGIRVEYVRNTANGKPEVPGISINLSHSGNVVICAVANKKVGCDIEEIRETDGRVATRFFCDSENEYLNSKKDEIRFREFFRIWTMKESYVKMTGEGLRIPINSFEIFPDCLKVRRDGLIQPCFMKEYEYPGYQITICSEDGEFENHIHQVVLLPE